VARNQKCTKKANNKGSRKLLSLGHSNRSCLPGGPAISVTLTLCTIYLCAFVNQNDDDDDDK